MSWPAPTTLEGEAARLVVTAPEHAPALAEAAADGELHRLWYTSVPTPAGVPAEIERRLRLMAAGSMLPFTVIERASGRPVGMTTYMNVDVANRRLEIGSTWYRRSMQRTSVNTECKLLLLRHAFEALDAIAVEFRTHFMNRQSRQAIERLGAKLDGVLRNHQIMANGTRRDTAVYSILDSEWPAVKANLSFRLERAG